MDSRRGKGVVAQARQIILNVYFFFHGEKDTLQRSGHPRAINLLQKTSDVTGVSKSTIRRIKLEAEAGELKTPGASRANRMATKTKMLDSFQTGALRRMVHNMYLQVRLLSMKIILLSVIYKTWYVRLRIGNTEYAKIGPTAYQLMSLDKINTLVFFTYLYISLIVISTKVLVASDDLCQDLKIDLRSPTIRDIYVLDIARSINPYKFSFKVTKGQEWS